MTHSATYTDLRKKLIALEDAAHAALRAAKTDADRALLMEIKNKAEVAFDRCVESEVPA